MSDQIGFPFVFPFDVLSSRVLFFQGMSMYAMMSDPRCLTLIHIVGRVTVPGHATTRMRQRVH